MNFNLNKSCFKKLKLNDLVRFKTRNNGSIFEGKYLTTINNPFSKGKWFILYLDGWTLHKNPPEYKNLFVHFYEYINNVSEKIKTNISEYPKYRYFVLSDDGNGGILKIVKNK